jgi:ribosome maturation factor RimP
MELLDNIENMLEPALSDMGYAIVRLHFGGEGRQRTLQIMAERLDEAPLSVGDCSEISKTASALMDVEDLIDGKYNLEVSSAGMERPLIKLADFERFKGRAAKIELDELIEGQRRFKGTLKGIDADDNILMHVEKDGSDVALPFSALLKAKLIVTEQMIKDATRKAKQK